MTLFFHLLYNQFAWTYDFVAWVVSFGKWKDWIFSIIEYLEPASTIELGFGPGHLQEYLWQREIPSFGLDLSKNMTRMANQRLISRKIPARVVHASSIKIPFPDNSFDQVISTFPSEYIFQEKTIREISRVLTSNGKFIGLLMASFTVNSIPNKVMGFIFRLTGQTTTLDEQTIQKIITPFQHKGLKPFLHTAKHEDIELTFLVASKTGLRFLVKSKYGITNRCCKD